MRGKWNLTEWERVWWQRELQRIIKERMTYNLDAYNLVSFDISPMQVCEVLESLSWKMVDRDREGGWDVDIWQYFENEDYPEWRICVYSNGMSFDLTLDVARKDA